MKKILMGLFIVSSIVTLSNDGGKEFKRLEKINRTYTNTLKKYEALENNTHMISDEIKSRYNIESGKHYAGEKIAATFNYYKSNTYEVYTKVNFTTALKFNSDEEIVYVGGGDTENWMIDETKGGSDGSAIIFVKPNDENLLTNLTVVTTKRTYFIMLHSSKNRRYNPLVEWSYPYEASMKFKRKDGKAYEYNHEIKSNVKDAKDLNFGYTWSKKYSFSPEQVYNDGVKTIIILPKQLQESPVVYGYSEDGELTLINSRTIDNKIIIDKVVNKLQLVLGKIILDIERH